jgi:hypothetical protein
MTYQNPDASKQPKDQAEFERKVADLQNREGLSREEAERRAKEEEMQ